MSATAFQGRSVRTLERVPIWSMSLRMDGLRRSGSSSFGQYWSRGPRSLAAIQVVIGRGEQIDGLTDVTPGSRDPDFEASR